MIRVTGGMLRGRRLRAPRGIRPTQDMVREAVFSMLASRIPGCRFLDLFAGSGAVGLEALSRGAAEVVWVEQARSVLPVLEANLRLVGVSPGQVRRLEAGRFVRGRAERAFDVVFADPPYGDEAEGTDWRSLLLQELPVSGLVEPGGLLVVESAAGKRRNEPPDPPAAGWEAVADRRYGRARVRVYRRLEAGREGGLEHEGGDLRGHV
jgi:16S rRNA (guanine966-N2)-methyltransferase